MSATPEEANDRIRAAYARLAGRYDLCMAAGEGLFGFRSGRRWAAGGAAGRVLEIGIGTGRNLAIYPPQAAVTGIDLSPEMLTRARARAANLGRRVVLHEADMAMLPFEGERFDVVVSTLTLCTVTDPVAAIREAVRVLVPGGQLRCLEHGRGHGRLTNTMLHLLEPAALRREGDHLLREPDLILASGGAVLETIRRYRAGVTWRLLAHRAA